MIPRRQPLLALWITAASCLIVGCPSRKDDGQSLSGNKDPSRSGPQRKVQPPRPKGPAPGIPEGYAVAFDFMHNRPHALFFTENGLVMRCGEPGFAKFLDGTWKNPWILNQVIDGRRVAYMYKDRGWIIFPAPLSRPDSSKTGPYVLEMVVHNREHSQRLHISLNGRYVQKNVKVPKGRNKIRVEVDPARVQPGENVMRFSLLRMRTLKNVPPADWRAAGRYGMRGVRHPKSPAAFEAIGIGNSKFKLPEDATSPQGFIRRVQLQGKEKEVFALPDSGRMTFYVVPPATGKLSFRHAVPKGRKGKGRFTIRLTADGAPPKKVYDQPAAPGWKAGAVDLTAYAGRAVRLDFVNRAIPGLWADVRLYSKPSRQIEIKKKPIRYIFYWVSDTLRQDAVGVYGSKECKTPNFDAFARKGVMFEQATIQGNHSKPSHGTLLSGTYPPVHGYEHKFARIKETLLYEVFKKAGWKTAMFSSNGYISSKWGFNRGLDMYVNTIRSRMNSETEYLWKWTKRWFKKHIKEKVFIYELTIDPHVTYDPPDKFLKMYWPGRYRGPIPRRMTGDHLARLIRGQIRLRKPEDLKRLKALYYGEVSYNDHWFGVMLKDLKEMGVLDQSVIVMTSDHGDQFRERGSYGHAKTLHEEEIAMPLLLWWPGLPDKPIRVPWDVEVMDVYATLLDIAGIKQNPTAQSASLLPLIRGGRAEAMHAAFSYNFARTRSVKLGRYKLMLYDPYKLKLYDLRTDPGEKERADKKRPIALRLMRNVFSLHNGYLSRWRKTRWGRASNLDPRFNMDFSIKKPPSAKPADPKHPRPSAR